MDNKAVNKFITQHVVNRDDLNAAYAILNNHAKFLDTIAIRFLAPGDKVEVTGKSGPWTGEVIKVNRSRVHVRADHNGRLWSVSASALTKVE